MGIYISIPGERMMKRLLIPLLAFVLSGCTTLASQSPTIAEVAYKPLVEVPEPDQGKIVLAVYQFGDLTGQQKPNTNFGEMSKAITQGSVNLLIKALKDAGDGKWFRVVERDSLQSLLQERKLIRTTRQMTQGENAQPLGPMLYAGAYITGGIVGYDSNTVSGGAGARYLGIGGHAEYRHDTVTVMLRLINVVSGEVELAIMAEKSILSISTGADVFRYLDTDTQLLEIEVGVAKNEPVTYAVRKVIEASVVELINAGEVKGLWSYKPEPWVNPGEVEEKVEEEVEETPTTEELLEEIIETDDETQTSQKEEVYDDYKKKPEVVEVIEVEIEEEEIEVMEVGDPPGQSNGDDLEELIEEPNEEITPNIPVITPDIANILRG